jgi:hypothetical protein
MSTRSKAVQGTNRSREVRNLRPLGRGGCQWNGKRVRRNSLTPLERELELCLQKDKKLTARWYDRMSGGVGWAAGEKDDLHKRFDALALQIGCLLKRVAEEKEKKCLSRSTIREVTGSV